MKEASGRSRTQGRVGWGTILWLGGLALLFLALRGTPLADVVSVVGRLGAGRAALILLINVGVILALTSRWWLLLRLQGYRISLLWLAAYRVAAFSINYLTPGTHVGGEPLQALLLARRHAIPVAQAAASVVLDKALEAIGNSAFLVFGVSVMASMGLLPAGTGGWLLAAAGLLLGFPVLYLVVVGRGWRPISGALDRLAGRWGRLRVPAAFARQAEGSVGEFCQKSPGGVAASFAASGLSWAALLIEYNWMLHFLNISLNTSETIVALTAARLALLTPVPGALGILEGSQVVALTALGRPAAEGAGLGLVIRARDLVYTAIGLALAGWLSNPQKTSGIRD